MGEAKIRLSQKEMEIASSTELILTKNTVLQKVKLLLAALQEEQQKTISSYANHLPAAIANSSAKISRGENYKGLPYFILDHPRVFEQENIAAIRTMFWWGNFFSTTLHLSGNYKIAAEKKIANSFLSLQEQGFFICTHDEQWEHHFEADNYVPLAGMEKDPFSALVQKKAFVKLSNKISLQQWDEAPVKLLSFFDQLLMLVMDQLPKR